MNRAALVGVGNHFGGCEGRLREEGCGQKDKQEKRMYEKIRDPRSLRLHSELPSAQFKAHMRLFPCASMKIQLSGKSCNWQAGGMFLSYAAPNRLHP
jgi:hypothetical protein